MVSLKCWWRYLGVALVAVVWTGCTTPTVTNLTPSYLPRKETGQYSFAVEFYSRQSTILRDTMKAYVIIGSEKYPMARTPMLTNRFETLVPIPTSRDSVTYRYRFEYDYRGIPEVEAASKDSKYYQLSIRDR